MHRAPTPRGTASRFKTSATNTSAIVHQHIPALCRVSRLIDAPAWCTRWHGHVNDTRSTSMAAIRHRMDLESCDGFSRGGDAVDRPLLSVLAAACDHSEQHEHRSSLAGRAGAALRRGAARHRRRTTLVGAALFAAAVLVIAAHGVTNAVGRSMGPPQLLAAAGGRDLAACAECAEAKAAFVQEHPEYGYNGWLDAHWGSEVGARLPPGGHYLDFTGSGLYTTSQLAAASAELGSATFGNPHSASPSSARSTAELEQARGMVLEYFRADPQEYVVMFVRSATEALKHVGEFFPWSPEPGWEPPRRVRPGGVSDAAALPAGSCGGGFREPAAAAAHSSFVYLRANHKSVLGIGTYAKLHGAPLTCIDEEAMDAWLASPPPKDAGGVTPEADVTYSLVAYPAKDNFEGRLYPLDWIDKVHARSTPAHRWLVVLDAAAHAATHPLDLSAVKPDFVPISFYKIFGLPTGVGALIARRAAASSLAVSYFGGGSAVDATAEDAWRVLLPPPASLEIGTPPFLDVVQLKHGFGMMRRLGGVEAAERHSQALRLWAAGRLAALRHAGGAPLLRLFGAHGGGRAADERQSGVFAFLVLQPNGSALAAPRVQADAAAAGLHIRAGCVCNPGICHHRLGIRPEEARARALEGAARGGELAPFIYVTRPAPGGGGAAVVRLAAGAVRASLGPLSTFEDVCALIQFLKGYQE
ncbi:MAG: pyridoxal phosphate-dependent transferase [Monoraphidium minutum]|nr:MAG: pyridoxal phosphate-dependent transferase [Monoraphidium minutum]